MNYTIQNKNFDIRRTFLCGQCFRWSEDENGEFSGIAGGRSLTVTQSGDEVTLHGVSEQDISFWENYFDMGTDYSAYIEALSADETLKKACEFSPGIRILRQEPFETLISFIISQNNNIPRISGIIGRLCESFGTPAGGGYAFPTARQLSGIAPEDLAPLRAGFRARYICDAVEKVNSGAVDFAEIDRLPLAEAREQLKTIVGVGDKGADCVLLICALLDTKTLAQYLAVCDELGLSALVETHDANEIRSAVAAGAKIIGVNNRNLKDFTVDIHNSERLRELVPENIVFVSESGIKQPEDVGRLYQNKTDAVLIGETLMRSSNKKAELETLSSMC